MAFSTSDKRVTRSQARAGAPVASSNIPTPIPAFTPSSATQTGHGFSKAGRRVLAELACNDSPIVGLLPAGTPTSWKEKCSDGGPVRSRRALLADALPEQNPACTPLGESLLRSQVQLLLQKVRSDVCANEAPSVHMRNEGEASRIVFAAPTPVNTPSSANVTQMPFPDSQRDIDLDLQAAAIDETQKATEFLPSLFMLGTHPDSIEELLDEVPPVSSCSIATTINTELQPPLLVEVSDAPSSSEVFIGRRVLHFDEDTPCKTFQENLPSRVFFSEETGHSTPEMRQLDEDEVSEWSVNVNVGSPADKQCLAEVHEGVTLVSLTVEEGPSMHHEHVKKMQQVSSRKVHLLWDEDGERVVVRKETRVEGRQEKNDDEADGEEEEEEDEEYSEDFYHGEDEGDEEFGDLCDMFRDMGFGEASKSLPKGEGKHIRFLYENGDDEIVESMIGNGEEDVSLRNATVRLKGLPAPLGRHWRFAQDEE